MGTKQSCTKIESKLIEYLDGRIKPAESRAMEAHLTECMECRTRAEDFRAVWSVLDDVPTLSPSSSFDASLRARISSEPVRHNFWNWLPSPRLAFAVTALVAMSVWISVMPRVGPNQSSSQVSPRVSSQISADADFGVIRDLPVLENYDVLSKFDALSELPDTQGTGSNTFGGAKKENR